MHKTKSKVQVNYPLGDFLIRVKNAGLAKRRDVSVDKTALLKNVALALKKMGVLSSIEEKEGKLEIKLTFVRKEPRLIDLKLISKPGLRIYMGADELRKIKSPSQFLVSTSKGVMTSLQAQKEGLGGEVLVEVW